MIVVNHEARIFHIAEHCTLMPGVNSPDVDAWQKAKDTLPVVQHLLDEEVLEERAIEIEQIAKLAPRAAIKLAKNTVAAALLKRMQATEKRREVLDVIEEQLAAIAPGKPSKDDKAADEGDGEELEPLPETSEELAEQPEPQPAPKQKRTRKRAEE
jgi:hypothetical protein